MTTDTITDPVQAAEGKLADARQARAALLIRIRDGEEVATEDLVAVEKDVEMAEIRLEGAASQSEQLAEADRQAEIAAIMAELESFIQGDSAERLGQRLENFTKATVALAEEWRTQKDQAHSYRVRLSQLGDLPPDVTVSTSAGVTYRGKRGEPADFEVLVATILARMARSHDLPIDQRITAIATSRGGLGNRNFGPLGPTLEPYATDTIRELLDANDG